MGKRGSKAEHHLIRFHSFADSVAGSVVNDLQPLVNGRLEPVMEACQGQHFSIPVREEREKETSFLIKAEPRRRLKAQLLPGISIQQSGGAKCHGARNENKLEREELSETLQDFQRYEELEDGLSHGLGQSGALLLQSSTDALHGHVYVIGHLKTEDRFRTKTRKTSNLPGPVTLPASPAAGRIC